jgi:superfamily I DNA and/or RNA helicase
MASPERLNVLLSRARNGLILIGDANTFMGSPRGRDLWSRFIGMLKACWLDNSIIRLLEFSGLKCIFLWLNMASNSYVNYVDYFHRKFTALVLMEPGAV